MQSNTLKIGLFGIGLDAYWQQFAGLKERLEVDSMLTVRGIPVAVGMGHIASKISKPGQLLNINVVQVC